MRVFGRLTQRMRRGAAHGSLGWVVCLSAPAWAAPADPNCDPRSVRSQPATSVTGPAKPAAAPRAARNPSAATPNRANAAVAHAAGPAAVTKKKVATTQTTSKPKLAVVVRPVKAKPAAPPRHCGPATANALLETLAEEEAAEPAAYTWVEPKPSLLQATRKKVDTDDGWELDPLQGIWSGIPGERGPIAYGSGSGSAPIQGTLLASSGSWMGGRPGGSGGGQGMLGMGRVAVLESSFTGVPAGTPPGVPPGSSYTAPTYTPPPGSGPGDSSGGGGGESEKSITTTSESSQPPIEIPTPATAALVMLGLVLTARILHRR